MTGYTAAEHRRALDKPRADVMYDTASRVCSCGEPLAWETPHRAEADTGTAAWRGGWTCAGCGYVEEAPERDEQ